MSQISNSENLINEEEKAKQELKEIILKKENKRSLYIAIIIFFISLSLFSVSLIYGLRSFQGRIKELRRILINPPNLNQIFYSYNKTFNSLFELNENFKKFQNFYNVTLNNDSNDEFIPKLNFFNKLEIIKQNIMKDINLIDYKIKNNQGNEAKIKENLHNINNNITEFNKSKDKIIDEDNSHKKHYEKLQKLFDSTNDNIMNNIDNFNEFFSQYEFVKRLAKTVLNDYGNSSEKVLKNLNKNHYNIIETFNENKKENLFFSVEIFNKWIENNSLSLKSKKIKIENDSIIFCYLQFSFLKKINLIPKFNSFIGFSIIKQEDYEKNNQNDLEYNKFPYENTNDTFSFTQTIYAKKNMKEITLILLFKVFGDESIQLKNISSKCVVIQNYSLN